MLTTKLEMYRQMKLLKILFTQIKIAPYHKMQEAASRDYTRQPHFQIHFVLIPIIHLSPYDTT